ncbi:hypothetical protein, partial [Falsigemmobacter faecalis]|uniref:hypothetical protein n=1 Tax=Falsigemmobacter faecalis TaxID=2488730 RepID=UPI001F3DDCB2
TVRVYQFRHLGSVSVRQDLAVQRGGVNTAFAEIWILAEVFELPGFSPLVTGLRARISARRGALCGGSSFGPGNPLKPRFSLRDFLPHPG